MDYLKDEIYKFGSDTSKDNEPVNNFDFESIRGLGESNYENEDLFVDEIEINQNTKNSSNVFSAYNYQLDDYNFGNVGYVGQIEQNDLISKDNFVELKSVNAENETVNSEETKEESNIKDLNIFGVSKPEKVEEVSDEEIEQQLEKLKILGLGEPVIIKEEQEKEQNIIESDLSNIFNEEVSTEEPEETNSIEVAESTIEEVKNEQNIEETDLSDIFNEEVSTEELEETNSIEVAESTIEKAKNEQKEEVLEEEQSEIIISETSKEELEELTKFEDDKIEETDINSLFDKVSVNVKDASDIFRKNTDIKQKIDTRFEELKKLQSNLESSRKKQIDEIDQYKDEVLTKLTEKKDEIEKRLNILKEAQATLEKEKKEFEQYKKKEQENIDKVQKQVQAAYDDRREELSHIEDKLRKQKDALDEERNQLSLDKIQYESDKNELANNLLKFNEIVDSFTMGVNDIKE